MANIIVTCTLRVVPDMTKARDLEMSPEEVSAELMRMLEKLEFTNKNYQGYTWPGNGAELEVLESASGAPDFTDLVDNVNGWLGTYATDYVVFHTTPPTPFSVPVGSAMDVKESLYYYSDTEERWCTYGFQILDKKSQPWVMTGEAFPEFEAKVQVGLKYAMK